MIFAVCTSVGEAIHIGKDAGSIPARQPGGINENIYD